MLFNYKCTSYLTTSVQVI